MFWSIYSVFFVWDQAIMGSGGGLMTCFTNRLRFWTVAVYRNSSLASVILAEFPSAVDAVRHAVDVQRAMAQGNADVPEDKRIAFRIGISLGDVMVDGDDLFGNGVNVAARMEGLGEPGGICISGNVQEHIGNSLDVSVEDLGEQTVKNIDRPVRCYRVHLDSSADEGTLAKLSEPSLSAPDRPSIAVLPFDNISGDPEQEYFSDGITEDLITALSHIRQFRVIARNSTFSYKGRSTDIRTISRELGVRYVVEGSVRKAGNRIRVSAQLIEGSTGNHVWAKRYDRDLEDIFTVQDELTETLVGAIEPELSKAEQGTARRKPPENLSAWEYCQKAMWFLNVRDKDNIAEARRLFVQATELDPNFGPAFAGLADTYRMAIITGDHDRDRAEAIIAARRALELDPDDAQAHLALGSIYIADRNHEAAVEELKRATHLNPSYAYAHHLLSRAYSHSGRPAEALPPIQTAMRLSPNDPSMGTYHATRALAHLYLKQHEEAVTWSRSAISFPTAAGGTGRKWVFLISALGHLDREVEAKHAFADLLTSAPSTTINSIRESFPTSDERCIEHLIEGLRKAGLPE